MKHLIFLTAAAIGLAVPAHAQGATRQDAEVLIAEADANGDGNISREEFLARRSAAFDALDADESGVLTEPEFENAVSERIRRFSKRAFNTVDQDGDGTISQAEWDANPPRAFNKLDRNGDGVLSPSERERK